jgi:2-methylcitrate dehydratase
MPLIRDLSRFVAEFAATDLSQHAMEKARILLLDSLACAVAALDEPATRRILDLVRDMGGAMQCTVIGRSRRTSLPLATLANGMLIRTLDLNDFSGGIRITGHPSDNIAVALSAGESANRSGAEVLAAIALAYELYGRLADTMATDSLWDHVTVSGLVAPAVAAKLLGLDQDATAHALALGAAHAPATAGLRDGNVSGAKSLANAMVAQQGVQAALLARAGVTGPLGVLESRRGLGQAVFTNAASLDLAPARDDSLRIMDSHIKAYPCVATAQALVAAAQRLRAEHALTLSEITRIRVVMADVPVVRDHLGDRDRHHPHSRESADHSFNFLLAVTLSDGELSARQFEGERWASPEIAAAMARIEYVTSRELAERAPNSFAAVLNVETIDGRSLQAEMLFAPGHARNPFSFDQATDKFRSCARRIMAPEAQNAVLRAVGDLESADTISSLMALFATDMPLA